MARYLIGNGDLGAWLYGPETLSKCLNWNEVDEDKHDVFVYDSKITDKPLYEWVNKSWVEIEQDLEAEAENITGVDSDEDKKIREAYKLPAQAMVIYDDDYGRYKEHMKILGNKDEDVKRIALRYIKDHHVKVKINLSPEMGKVIIVIPEKIKNVRRIELH